MTRLLKGQKVSPPFHNTITNSLLSTNRLLPLTLLLSQRHRSISPWLPSSPSKLGRSSTAVVTLPSRYHLFPSPLIFLSLFFSLVIIDCHRKSICYSTFDFALSDVFSWFIFMFLSLFADFLVSACNISWNGR